MGFHTHEVRDGETRECAPACPIHQPEMETNEMLSVTLREEIEKQTGLDASRFLHIRTYSQPTLFMFPASQSGQSFHIKTLHYFFSNKYEISYYDLFI